MNQPTLGEFLNHAEEMPGRDAIHVAILPLIAGAEIYRGSAVKLKYGTTNVGLTGEYSEKYTGGVYKPGCAIGIADPFIPDYYIEEGRIFYCLLYPKTITGLEHHWNHPAIDQAHKLLEGQSEEYIWLQQFAEKYNIQFDEMVKASVNKGYITASGVDVHGKSSLDEGEYEKFWECIEAHVGKKFKEEHRDEVGWSCSC